MMRWIWLGLALGLGFNATVYAGTPIPFPGFKLKAECYASSHLDMGESVGTVDDVIQASNCTSYIRGYMDAALMFQERGGRHTICPPDTLDYEKAQQIVTRWLEHHTSDLDYPSSWLVYRALHSAWPCKGKK